MKTKQVESRYSSHAGCTAVTNDGGVARRSQGVSVELMEAADADQIGDSCGNKRSPGG